MQNHEDLNGIFEAQVENHEINVVIEKLETMEDEQLAVEYLKDLNDRTSKLNKMLFNRDQEMDHGTWKVQCDELKSQVDILVSKIMSH